MLRGIPAMGSDVGGLREAMLGTDNILPAKAIPSFSEQLDENMIPIGEVPEQDIEPWRQAIERRRA